MQYLPNAQSATTLIASSNVKSAIASWKTIECTCHSMFISRTLDAVGKGNGLCMGHLNIGVKGVIMNVRLIFEIISILKLAMTQNKSIPDIH
jgi:hypothetical protein